MAGPIRGVLGLYGRAVASKMTTRISTVVISMSVRQDVSLIVFIVRILRPESAGGCGYYETSRATVPRFYVRFYTPSE
jgi:hypothetical protein